MTMNEYRGHLTQTIPTPETLQQSMLEYYTKRLINELMDKGEASLTFTTSDGNRNVLTNIGKGLTKMFKAQGYKVSTYKYSSTSNKIYWIYVEIPLDK